MVGTTTSVPSWQAVGFSVQGARHVQNNAPCQDAFHVRRHQDHPIIAIATADGHGDPKHEHSDVGAQLAVTITTKLLLEAAAELMLEATKQPEIIRDQLYRHLPKRIAYEWNRAVKEKHQLSQGGAWHEVLIKYGTTIMGVVVSRHYALYLQLGDGDILMTSQTQDEPRFIFGQSEDLFGSVTHSLCQPNADLNTMVSCERLDQPEMLILATDGIRDCLEDETAMKRVPAWLMRKLKSDGLEALDTIIPDWLNQLSARGNGDDATIAFIVWNKDNEEIDHADAE